MKEESGNRNAVESAASAKNYNGGENGKAGSETNIGCGIIRKWQTLIMKGMMRISDAEEFDSNAMIPPLGHSSDKDNG